MTISRPLLLMPGTKRSRNPMHVPAAGRWAVGDGTGWGFIEPVKATTANASWTLSENKAALIWDGGPTTAIALDLDGHAYMIFALENTDQLYAVVQEDWESVTSSSVICPIAWVDAHLDLTPRLLGSTISFVLQTSDGSLFTYGAAPSGALPYPAGGTGAGLVGSAFPTVSDMRLATRGSSVMVLLNNGNLAYLATAGTSATSVLVTIPRFTATDVIPRVLGINADPVAGIWYALVEYDPGASTYRGLVVLQASGLAATNATDWSIAYTILDMTTAPTSTPATPGLNNTSPSLSAATEGVAAPSSPVSGNLLFDAASGFSQDFVHFGVAVDTGTSLAVGITVRSTISVFYASGGTGSFGAQTVGFPGTPSPGTYVLYADPVHSVLGMAASAPAGTAPLLTVTVAGRASDVYAPAQGGAPGRLSDPVTLANPQTFPAPASMTMGFGTGSQTHSGMFVTTPGDTSEYSSGAMGFRTDDISISLPYDVTNPLLYLELVVHITANEDSTGNFNGSTSFLVGTLASGGDDVTVACVQRATTLPHTNGYFTQGNARYSVGPTITATATIGSASPPPAPTIQALGVGPQGETLVNDGTSWSYWAPGTSPRSSAFSDVVVGTFISRFGPGTPSPICIDFEMIDGTGALDTNPVRLACYDAPNDVYYGVFNDGDLRQRIGAVPAAWTILSVSFVPTPTFTPMAIRLRSGLVQCIYGVGNQVFLATYNTSTGAVTRSAPVTFPTYEHNGPGTEFGVAAFLN